MDNVGIKKGNWYYDERVNKGAYEGKHGIGDETWNIHHIDSDPRNNICVNLVATHPECNQELG